MAITIKLLKAFGYSANVTNEDLYTAPDPGLGVIANNIRFSNDGANSVTLDIFVRKASNSTQYQIDRKVLGTKQIHLVKPELILEKSDKIQITTSGTSPSWRYCIFGVEKSS
jgi:hypothetical protein